MFADASALTAVIAREEGHEDLVARLETASVRLTSPIALSETVAAVARIFTIPPVEARPVVLDALGAMGIVVREVPAGIVLAVQDAFERYGKGQGARALGAAQHGRLLRLRLRPALRPAAAQGERFCRDGPGVGVTCGTAAARQGRSGSALRSPTIPVTRPGTVGPCLR